MVPLADPVPASVCISLFAGVGTVFGIPAGVVVGSLSAADVDHILPAPVAFPVAVPAAVGFVFGTPAYIVAAYMVSVHNFDRNPSVADEDTVAAGTLFAVAAVAVFGTAAVADGDFGNVASAEVASSVGFAAVVGISAVLVVFLYWFYHFLSLIGSVSVHFSTTVGFLILMPIDDIGYFVINASFEVQP